jgi:hypothetical protein
VNSSAEHHDDDDDDHEEDSDHNDYEDDEEELEDAEVFPQGPAVYWRLLGRPGGGTRFSESHFDLLVSLLEGRERGVQGG